MEAVGADWCQEASASSVSYCDRAEELSSSGCALVASAPSAVSTMSMSCSSSGRSPLVLRFPAAVGLRRAAGLLAGAGDSTARRAEDDVVRPLAYVLDAWGALRARRESIISGQTTFSFQTGSREMDVTYFGPSTSSTCASSTMSMADSECSSCPSFLRCRTIRSTRPSFFRLAPLMLYFC